MVEFYPRRSNQGRGSFLSGPRRCLLNAICLACEELGGKRATVRSTVSWTGSNGPDRISSASFLKLLTLSMHWLSSWLEDSRREKLLKKEHGFHQLAHPRMRLQGKRAQVSQPSQIEFQHQSCWTTRSKNRSGHRLFMPSRRAMSNTSRTRSISVASLLPASRMAYWIR